MGNRGTKEQEREGRRSFGVKGKLSDSGKRIKGKGIHDRLTRVHKFPGQGDNREGKQENEKNESRLRGGKAQRDNGGEGGRIAVHGDGGADVISRSVAGITVKGEKNITCETVNLLGQGDGGAKVKQKTKETGSRSLDVRGRRVRKRGAVVEEESAVGGKVITALTQDDYLQLLKCLNIKLPEGVVTQEVIALANTKSCIQDAEAILQELENFHICFKTIPRLPCREVKRFLNLKRNGQILQITKLLFFEKEDKEEQREEQWRKNKTKTSQGFRLRDKYMDDTTAVSTPALYSTAVTRSRSKVEVGDDSPIVTGGTRVNLSAIEGIDYCDESELWKNGGLPGPGTFGKFFENNRDELEMLKFFHELRAAKKTVAYSKGNKVEYGFLNGRLDFLARFTQRSGKIERLVIECKGTTGDMVGKLFTKKQKSAKIDQKHEFSFQVQAYMYILNREAEVKKFPQMRRAVLVVRHYHQGGNPPRDFGWSYVHTDPSVQEQIEQLRLLCQGEVLARYLALLNLIFQKEAVSL